jgi:hypothetical protein
MSASTRLKLGVALLILGLVMPAGTLLVAATDWPIAVKTVVSGILLFGFEIVLIPAVALMGKDNFERIWAGAMRLLKALKPAGNVGRTRYKWGLYMLVGPALYAWIASYVPSWLPEDYVLRILVNVGLDLITLASLFVLGGDFLDKVRALSFTTPVSSCLPEGIHGYLERSAAANAMIGVAYDPSRTSPHARNDPLGLPVAIGDESGARRRRHAGAAGDSGMSVTHPKPRISERSRGCGESDHVASPFHVGFSNFEFDGLTPSSTSTSIVLFDHTWVSMPAGSAD